MISPWFTGPDGMREMQAWLAWLEAFQTVSDSELSED